MLYTPFRTLPMNSDRMLYLCITATAMSPAPFDARALLCTSLVSQMGHRDVGVMILPTCLPYLTVKGTRDLVT